MPAQSFKSQTKDFPGGLMVKNPPCNSADAASAPGQGTKIPMPQSN